MLDVCIYSGTEISRSTTSDISYRHQTDGERLTHGVSARS